MIGRTSGCDRGLTTRPTRIMASIRHQTQVSSQAQSSVNKRQSGWISGIALILPLCTYTVSFILVERKCWDFWILRPTISERNLSWVQLAVFLLTRCQFSDLLAVGIMRLKQILQLFPMFLRMKMKWTSSIPARIPINAFSP